MMIGLMLFAAAAGQVIETGGGQAVVRTEAATKVGDVLVVRRLESTPGAPGRLPFFQWSKAGKVRVLAVRADGTAEVAVLRGRFAKGDRVSAD